MPIDAPTDLEIDEQPPFTLPRPSLEQGRIALRPWGAGSHDAELLTRAWTDPEVVRWARVPEVHDERAATRWVERERDRRELGVGVDLVIVEPGAPDVVLGEVGCVMAEAERRWAEIGFWLFPGVRGAGRATAAVEAFSDWALATQPIARLFARIQADNGASERVVERAGYHKLGELDDGTRVWVLDAPTS